MPPLQRSGRSARLASGGCRRIKYVFDMQMYIVYLCGGRGERFRPVSPIPKPECLIFGRPMFEWSLDSWAPFPEEATHVIATRPGPDGSGLFERIRKYLQRPAVHVEIPYDTRGAAETLYLVCRGLPRQDVPIWVLDNDICGCMPADAGGGWGTIGPGAADVAVLAAHVPVAEPGGPSPYSHLSLGPGPAPTILGIAEKRAIGTCATMGGYGFASAALVCSLYRGVAWADVQLPERYISVLVQASIDGGMDVRAIIQPDAFSIGTPDDVAQAIRSGRIRPRPLRWVFVLDDVHPIRTSFVQALYDQGHHITIIAPDAATVASIPFHELRVEDTGYHWRIDARSSNPQAWHGSWKLPSIGFGFDEWLADQEVEHSTNESTSVVRIADTMCSKHAPPMVVAAYADYMAKADGLPGIRGLFPRLFAAEGDHMVMEWVKGGIPLNQLLACGQLERRHLDAFGDALDRLHGAPAPASALPAAATVRQAYMDKLHKRVRTHPHLYELLDVPLPDILARLEGFFASYEPDVVPWIHGDPWFSNVLWMEKAGGVMLLDVRGAVGDQITTGGDRRYDLAKVYQSCIGFHGVLAGDAAAGAADADAALAWFRGKWGAEEPTVRRLTICLLLGYMPFHAELHMPGPALRRYGQLIAALDAAAAWA